MRNALCHERLRWCVRATLTLTIGLAACSDVQAPPPTASPQGEKATAIQAGQIFNWNTASDTAFWNEISSKDRLITVGLKQPGALDGLIDGRRTISRSQWSNALHLLATDPGYTVVHADSSHLPIARVKVESFEALQRIRRLPFVAFAEPAHIKMDLFDSCGDGNSLYNAPVLSIPSINPPNGADTVAAIYSVMNVPNAWKLDDGLGVIVGVIDTGIDEAGGRELSPNWFGGRMHNTGFATHQGAWDMAQVPTCSHGTRIAGLAVAPRNGRNVLGAAYMAGLISVEHANSPVGAWEGSAQAIHYAATRGATVIIMAFGGLEYNSSVAWEIQDHTVNNDVVFVGAAGTGWKRNAAAFPASHHNVIAVSGAEHDGTRPEVFDWGSKYPGVLGYTNLATTAMQSNAIVNIAGSSGATGLVGGVVALMRGRNPTWSRNVIVEKLVKTSGGRCGAPWIWRDDMINASAAVGGPCVGHLTNQQVGKNMNYSNVSIDTVITNLQEVTSVFRVPIVTRLANTIKLGGSGNYRVEWFVERFLESGDPGAILEGSGTVNTVAPSTGDSVLALTRTVRVKPASVDYFFSIRVRVYDDGLGTVEERQRYVWACRNQWYCNPQVNYPGPPVTPPPAPFSAQISGNTEIGEFIGCSWSVIVNGGTEPFSYAWKVNGQPWGGNSSSLSYENNGSPFSLEVVVTDGEGRTATPSYYVNISPGQYCM